MKRNIKFIIAKSVFLLVFIQMFKMINTAVSPIIANYLALNQMNNSIDSSFGIQIYSYINNYSWVLIVIACIVLFAEDFINIKKFLKEKEDVEDEEERN